MRLHRRPDSRNLVGQCLTEGDMPLAVVDRRRAMRLAYWNGAIWALGNGLTSSTLVLYLAMELKVPGIGLGISLILAAPQLAGLLRLAAPPVIGRLVGRKQFCLGAYMLSAVVLAGLPMVAAPGRLSSPETSLCAWWACGACISCSNTWARWPSGRGWPTWCRSGFAAASWAAGNAGWPAGRPSACWPAG